jgi:branched-chain amino acid transport system permease protein
MTAVLFGQLVVNGLAVGSIYILVVLGLDVILRGTKILNFAHGQFYMLGAYTLFAAYQMLHLNFALSLALSGLAVLLLGALSYLAVFNIVQRRFTVGAPFSFRLLVSAMASVGLMMILQQGTLLVFGTAGRGIPSVFTQMIAFGDFRLPSERLVIILISTLACFGLYLLMFKTKLGKAMRAVSADSGAASLLGVNTFRIFLVCFAVGSALAGIAGGIIAPVFAVTPEMGTNMIFMAILVLIIGGIGSYKGTVLGGILIGLALSFGYQFFGGFSQVFIFILAIVILTFKPGGILGEARD